MTFPDEAGLHASPGVVPLQTADSSLHTPAREDDDLPAPLPRLSPPAELPEPSTERHDPTGRSPTSHRSEAVQQDEDRGKVSIHNKHRWVHYDMYLGSHQAAGFTTIVYAALSYDIALFTT